MRHLAGWRWRGPDYSLACADTTPLEHVISRLIAPCFKDCTEGGGLDEFRQVKGSKRGLLSYESSTLPHRFIQQLGAVTRNITTIRLLSSERAMSCVHFMFFAIIGTVQNITHSFAIRPRQAKKARDSNETLQERRGEKRRGIWM